MNTRYTPPFTISAEAISLIAEISAQIERYAIRLEQSDGLKLRKANRIKTIHSSLAIEGNALSEDQVSDIIEGKQVFAPSASSKKNDCSPFIDFMLNEILNTIKRHKGNCSKCKFPNKIPNKIPNKLLNDFPDFSDSTWNVLRLIMQDPHASAIALGERLGTSDRMIRKHISLLKSADIIKRIGSNKKGYWEVTITE